MTEEYKKQLIDYTTGLLNQENPDPKDFNLLKLNFQQYKDSFNEFFTNLSSLAKNLRITGILENENYDISILYGAYLYNDPDASLKGRGFLIYLDRDNNVINVLFKDRYNNYLRGFHKLYFDEASNRVYGVIGHPTANNIAYDEPNLFTYMNNLLIPNSNGEYEVDIKTSYNLNMNSLSVIDIVKHPNSSNYLMVATEPYTLLCKVVQYKINVGSSNEKVVWDINHTLAGCYLWFGEDTPHFKVIYSVFDLEQSQYVSYFGLAEDNGDEVSFTRLNNIAELHSETANVLAKQNINYIGKNANEIYFSRVYSVLDSSVTPNIQYQQTRLYKYDGTTTISTLYSSPITSSVYPDDASNHDCYCFNFYKDTDGTIYLFKQYVDVSENKVYISLLNFTKYSSDITQGEWVDLDPLEYEGKDNIYYNFTTIQRNYNISRIFNVCGDVSEYTFTQENLYGYILTLTNLFNLDGYNGTPYSGVDSLVPKYVNLYNGNDLIFSRNLYNITKQSNSSMSSVSIPSDYLNNITITTNDLIGKTNIQMNSNPVHWNKNIYEVVDLNFINSISVIDEDTNIPYPNSAIRLNNAITDGGSTNYQNAPCIKYRINYSDNTNTTGNLTWTKIADLQRETSFSISVDKEINNIDLISSDGNTIYLTISGTFEVGKDYTINQKVRIGSKSLEQDLIYNSEEVFYNGEQVKVYTN